MMPLTPANPLAHCLELRASNPLLASLPDRLSRLELGRNLRSRPITEENLRNIPIAERLNLLDQYTNIFIPTPLALAIADALQHLLHNGLARRDPHLAEVRRFINLTGSLLDRRLQDLPWWPSSAAGMVVEGITGLGKSHAIDRFLCMLPQVIDHSANEACGWITLKQVVWLKVHMPSDGSRGGFLMNGLLELDKLLGTDYSTRHRHSSSTIEKLLVIFLHLLSVHRCGLLIIEEAQDSNLAVTAFAREFIMFFLRVLNWGIPTVLIGNPLAFSRLREHSQDVDRFSEGGWFHLEPEMDPTSEDWAKGWINNLWKPTLLDLPDQRYQPFSENSLDQTIEGFVWRRTGGFPRYVCRLRREVQAHALRTGAAEITPAMVDHIYKTSPQIVPLHHRIAAFVNKDARTLNSFLDIPSEHYRKLWKPESIHSNSFPLPPADSLPLNNRAPSTRSRSLPEKSRKTEKSTSAHPEKLQAEDIRSKEFQDKLIQQITQASGAKAK